MKIAIDANSLQRLFRGDEGRDVEQASIAVRSGTAILPPVVLTEALSNPRAPAGFVALVHSLPLLSLKDDYWIRAADLRRALLLDGLKAKLADCLIAQSCIDHDVPLITYDRDFRHFAKAGLMLP